jgi:hypothetical protein
MRCSDVLHPLIHHLVAIATLVALGPVACDSTVGTTDGTGTSAASRAVPASATASGSSSAAPGDPGAAAGSEAPSARAPTGADARSDAGAAPTPLTTEAFRALIDELSEPGADFFSDNYITNETSYLQSAPRYAETVRRGGIYLGVGPEQNFSYIAASEPVMAYVVDIRRANLVLHLFYKAIFDLARSRAEFLTLLGSRPYQADGDPGPDATLEQVIAHAERVAPSKQSFADAERAIRERIEHGYGMTLRPGDWRDLRAARRAFFDKQLDLRFELKDQSVRRYPPLRELLAARDPAGQQGGFLASETAFRFVQRMQREHRIVPLVGDFGGSKALLALGERLKRSGQVVSTFYVSNVEQYLFENGVWHRWVRNIEALPTDERSLFIRCYLDQGRRHPRQMQGHRTTTVLQRIADFLARERAKPYRSMWSVSTDDWLPDAGAADAAP